MKNLLYAALLTFLSFGLIAQTDILPPVLIAPDSGAINQMPDVELDWYASSGVGQVTYNIEIATNPQFENAVTASTATSAFKNSNLNFGELYFWRVSATDETGTSDWSDIFSFTVFHRILLDKPNNAAVDQMPDVVLSRKEKVDNVEYSGFHHMQCQIDTAYDWIVENITVTEEDLNAAFFANETLGWTVGESGTILAYDNGSWSVDTIYYFDTDTTLTSGLNSIHNGFIVGNEGTFLHYSNEKWMLGTIEVEDEGKGIYTGDLFGLFAFSGDNIWAVGESGNILHKGAPQNWEVIDVGDNDLNSVYFVDENSGWAVGNGGLIEYFNGSEWITQESTVTKDLLSVYFIGPNHGWACGKSGTIVFYNGTGWAEVESNTSKDLHAIFMIDEDYGLAAGKDGVFLIFDSGEWYETSNSGTTNTLNSIFAIDADFAWIAGVAGTIISRNDDGFSSPQMEIFTTSSANLSVEMSNLLFNTKYFWRMRVIHDADTSGWSSVRYFNTINGIELVAPGQNATNQNPDILLEWNEITGIDSYIYQLCKNPQFVLPCITDFSETNSVMIPNLFFGDTYYWRVKAAHFIDSTAWSEVRNFTIINTVILDSPENGAADIELLPSLKWNTIAGVDQYQAIWNNEDNTYRDTAFTEVSTFNMFKPLELGVDYFWKVRAIKNGDTTNWSEEWQFHTGPLSVENVSLNGLSVRIYPNPATDLINIEFDIPVQSEVQVFIMDMVGKTISENTFNISSGMKSKTMDISNMDKGIYLLTLQSGEHKYSRKLIIK